MSDAESSARRDTPYPAEALRLTFHFEGDRIELVSQQRVRMIAPAQAGAAPEQGKSAGSWVELQDRRGRRLAHRLVIDPFRQHADHHSPDGKIEHFERTVESGEFEVLLPAHDNGAAVSVWSSPRGTRALGETATEIARFDLRSGKEAAS